jgi:hypothetical protein
MLSLPSTGFYYTTIDIVILCFAIVNAILLITGIGKFAIFNAIDSVFYLFFPKLSLKYDFRKYYPPLIKKYDGETMPAFRTPRDDYYPEYGPLYERIGDFILRFPLFSLTFFVAFAPVLTNMYGPYLNALLALMRQLYPGLPTIKWNPYIPTLFRLSIVLFFITFSSFHTAKVSVYAIVVYPIIFLLKLPGRLYQLMRVSVPPVLFPLLFVLLFASEVLIIYTGFLPLFHQGLIPFIENGPGLKQFIFWVPIKFKVYIDLILAPIVIVVPLITTIGSYVLAKHNTKEEQGDINYLVLFYKTGIAYFYAPLFGKIFPRLSDESRAVRKERRINEILVLSMYIESLTCIAGTSYAYYHLSTISHIPFAGMAVGLMILVVFVPLIVFSSNGFQSYFLDTSFMIWEKVHAKISSLNMKKGTADA